MDATIQQAEHVEEVKATNNQLYFGGMVLALLFFLLEETTLNLPSEVNLLLKFLPMLMLSLRVLSIFSQFSSSEKTIAFLTLIVSVIVGVKSEHPTQLYATWALVFGAKGLSARQLFSVYFKVSALFCVMIVGMALTGFIENKVLLTGTRENIFGNIADYRGCYGYVWPTDFATHVFFIMMTYWILKDGKLNFLKVVAFLVITYVMLMLTDSRLGCGCIFLLVICSLALKIVRKLSVGKTEPRKGFHFSFFTVLWIPFLAILSFYATIRYNPADMFWMAVNLILSGRLRIGQEAIEDYGIPLLGQKYILYGGQSDPNLYNYIDSSYIQLFVIYGVVYMALILVAFYYLAYRSYRFRENTILAALFVAGISGAIAQHFIQFFMNPLLLLLFANRDLSIFEETCCNQMQIDLITKSD